VLLALDIEVEDLHDMGVAEAGDGLRFALETPEEIRGFSEVRMKDFDGDEAVEAGVVSFVNLGHAAATEAFLNLVFSEGAPGEVGHGGDYSGQMANDNRAIMHWNCALSIDASAVFG
jgi:hypothetical protein